MEIINKIDAYLLIGRFYGNFFSAYSFTNENIGAYLQFFDLKGKSLLTVGSSGDQAINASLAGCRDITICDICPLTKYFYYLKVAALLNLSREEFIKFLNIRYIPAFKNNNPYFFNKKTYDRIKSTLKWLDIESFLVWEYIIKKYESNDILKLFKDDLESVDIAYNCNNYLKSEENYNKTRDAIINTLVNFINMDISLLKNNKLYDNIWLSNVAQYLRSEAIDSLFENTGKNLNPDGKAILYYSWHIGRIFINGIPIERFTNLPYDKVEIPGILKLTDENTFAIYTKSIIKK